MLSFCLAVHWQYAHCKFVSVCVCCTVLYLHLYLATRN